MGPTCGTILLVIIYVCVVVCVVVRVCPKGACFWELVCDTSRSDLTASGHFVNRIHRSLRGAHTRGPPSTFGWFLRNKLTRA